MNASRDANRYMWPSQKKAATVQHNKLMCLSTDICRWGVIEPGRSRIQDVVTTNVTTSFDRDLNNVAAIAQNLPSYSKRRSPREVHSEACNLLAALGRCHAVREVLGKGISIFTKSLASACSRVHKHAPHCCSFIWFAAVRCCLCCFVTSSAF